MIKCVLNIFTNNCIEYYSPQYDLDGNIYIFYLNSFFFLCFYYGINIFILRLFFGITKTLANDPLNWDLNN